MLSKGWSKFIISLQKKKEREERRLFTVEGDKLVREFLMSEWIVEVLAGKPEYLASLPAELKYQASEIIPLSYDELKKISSLTTPHNALAVIRMPTTMIDPEEINNSLTLMIDTIQDPGNMGTIIRVAAWFGIKNIICSENSVDIYNQKVIQATMGALLSVKVHYTGLKEFLSSIHSRGNPVYAAMLDGKSIYSADLSEKGIILLGNESRGISAELLPLVTKKIVIPKFARSAAGVESLNVGMAASIIVSEFARRSL